MMCSGKSWVVDYWGKAAMLCSREKKGNVGEGRSKQRWFEQQRVVCGPT
jgi:hypothetical protein